MCNLVTVKANHTQRPHGPPAADHAHDAVPLEAAFDFLNTMELENGALVERLTSLDEAAEWLAGRGIVGDPAAITAIARSRDNGTTTLGRLVTTRNALRHVAHAVAHDEAPPRAAIDEV